MATEPDMAERKDQGSILRISESVAFDTSQDSCSLSCSIYEFASIAILEADYSAVKFHMDRLKRMGVTDLKGYFAKHHDEVIAMARTIKTIRANRKALEFFEAETLDQLDEKINPVFDHESYNACHDELVSFFEGNSTYESERILQTARGSIRYTKTKKKVSPGYEHDLSHVFIYITNITKLKQVMKELEESERKYRMMVKDAQDPIFLIDMETGLILETNKMGEQLLCCAEEEIIGMRFSRLFPKKEAHNFRSILQGLGEKDSPISKSFFQCRKCCRDIPVSISSNTIRINGKKCISVIFRKDPEHSTSPADECSNPTAASDSSSACRYLKGLSQRECEVLSLIVSGRTSKEIAGKLFISEKTVLTHRSRIMHKLNIHKTADLVRYALNEGLLT